MLLARKEAAPITNCERPNNKRGGTATNPSRTEKASASRNGSHTGKPPNPKRQAATELYGPRRRDVVGVEKDGVQAFLVIGQDCVSSRESKALDREVRMAIASAAREKDLAHELADTDRSAWIRRLLLRHVIEKAFDGNVSEFEGECDQAVKDLDEDFFNEAAKAVREIRAVDSAPTLIVRVLREAYSYLRREKLAKFYRRFLVGPTIERLEILRMASRCNRRALVLTKAELREEAVRRIQAQNCNFPIPETCEWNKYFKRAGLKNLPCRKAGRPGRNYRQKKGELRP